MELPDNIFENAFNLIGDPIFVKDRRHRLVMLNDASCRAIGKSREKMLGCTDHDFFPKEEADVFWARDEQVFHTGIEDINEESLTPPGGTHRTLLTRKQLYVDPRGNPFIVGIFKDITPLKKAETVLQRTNMVLEGMVRERTAELQRANAEMQVRINQLDFLNEKSRSFAHLLNREEVLEAILATFSGLFPGSPINLVIRDGKGIRYARQAGVPLKVLKAIGVLLAPNLAEDSRSIAFGALDPVLMKAFPKFSGYLWIPFRNGAGLLGGVQILLPVGWEPGIAADLPLLGALSVHAATALDNAELHESQGERARIEIELQMARKIQGNYIPDPPVIPGIALAGVCLPAREIGGDYLDYFRNENGDWIIVVADVCGKGIPAALVMTTLRSCVRAEGRRQESSKELLAAVNSLMGPELQREKSFITCLCLVVSARGDALNFTRAGHPWLVASGPGMPGSRGIASQGIALGLVPDGEFRSQAEEVRITLNPGDRFVAYTDGVDEAKDAEGRPYGKERLYSILQASRDLAPSRLIDAVLADVRIHTQANPQYDDMTLFCLEKLG
ncbi:MAG: SpoIIE family protein phosphatase [Fibrobacteres bacterium]|nr:SpoIIE family protein phosphatase [Fibrobacterota bacterium]